MTAPVYRPETYEADMILAVRDLLGHAMETSHETLAGVAPRPPAQVVLGDLWRSSDDAAGDPIIAETDDDAEDPVRSVRAAIALLWMADADGPGEGWGDVAEDLERRLWARGPAVDADYEDGLRVGDCESETQSCDCVGVADDGTPYGCVREPGHAEHHLSPDGWRWEQRGPWRDSPPDFVPEAIVLGREERA